MEKKKRASRSARVLSKTKRAVRDPERFDFEEVWKDLLYLEKHGHWKNGDAPAWAKENAQKMGTPFAGAGVLMWGYRFVAEKAMKLLQEPGA